ncbi:hormogonium polysaccharide biosynthesis protein HpsA [Leptodesmis sichuanensis]|uniref:hormogonium polysaccharide biosynthesis protein HpsA n=1 Tax=Leptodesmis sichuanensis TaxID=2906798 RepID=UPI001F160A8F|nr:hormogonium polysaccharide biosynthesis protein HpsA [Leptodesmis sichuanensis]UIE38791.1 hormogonium polysaccharide biosynthesis protein HpsA [Leptodesmis sichuanensis A121]
MSDRKAKSVQRLSRAVWKLYRRLSKGLVTWLLRSALLLNRQRRAAAGFVLPTTVFLILVVALTAGALSYRAYNSSTRTIGNIQSRAIYNAATPAIDRARSKIEALFKDSRYPGGVPSEAFLTSMMLNDGRTIKGVNPATPQPGINGQTDPNDPFTLLGEKRIDINGDGLIDNAWVYHDGETKSSVVYSITFSIPADDTNPGGLPGWKKLLQKTEVDKALGIDSTESKNAGPFVRTGPLSNSEAVTCRVSSGSTVEQGWYQDATDTSKLRKRFQIDAFVVKDEDAVSPGKPPNLTTLEFSQDRLLERGNKWGAWFRNDLEIFPGRQFNWNGAMHTEGSLLIGPTTANNFSAYLISSPSSCLFLPESNSEISVRQVAQEDNTQVGNRFTGVIGSGDIRSNSYGGGSSIHVYQNKSYDASRTLDPSTQLVNSNKRPYSVSLDPATIVTSDGYKAREGDPSNYTDGLPAVTNTNVFIQGKRIVLDPKGDRPYVDDTYRADNRYGPKPNYGKVADVPTGKIGQPINAADFPGSPGVIDSLTRDTPVGDPSTVGLDGYWERRSIVEGLRILVGQRLELGNPAGWVPPQDRPQNTPQQPDQTPQSRDTDRNGNFTDLRQIGNYGAAANGTNADPDTSDNEGDPLYPPHRFVDSTRAHEERQRRTLRDNLAAVQATAVYHYKADGAGTFPTACLVTTAHPGTPLSLQRSVDFRFNQYLSTTGAPEPWIDFFYGKGTNGWEFSPPAATEADFAAAIATGQPLGNALRNLANFAGDPEGAFPPQQGTAIRPDPTLTMWGNFSNLRRAVATLDASNYNSLSPADKAYLHTAACTLGMLAYNLEQVQKFDPTASFLAGAMTTLGQDLYRTMDGNNEPGEIPDVLPKEQLSTYKDASGNYTGTYNPANYNPRDYDRVTPAMFLAALKERIKLQTPDENPEEDARYQLALLIHEHYQLRRDRTYGFRPSPAANTWNYNPYLSNYTYNAGGTAVRKTTLWSSACDPNLFPVNGATQSGSAGATGFSLRTSAVPRNRVALSRLCGAVIPPGAVHDFPGDNNYPARGAALENPLDADTSVTDEFKKLSPTISSTSNTVFTQTTLNTAPYDDPSFKRALVAPEFPSLYYLFPEFDHDQDGDVRTVGGKTIDHRQPGNTTDGTPRLNQLPAAFQPWPEPYITTANSINSSVTYQAVSTADTPYTDGLFTNGEYAAAVSYTDPNVLPEGITSFDYKPFQPFPEKDKAVSFGSDIVKPGKTDLSDWKLPTASTPAANSPNRIRTPNNTVAAVAFQDKVLFNGREWQPGRVLDIDLDMLRSTTVGGTESWLPVGGVVYAFREDAVREDAIARPAGTTNPPSLPDVKQTDVRTPGAETDPPLTAGAVSTKPVDYVPDPDRRAHGFRLRNGEKLKRTAGGVDAIKNTRGLSFFSDNPAYIMGNFNKHQDSNGNRLEEFTQQVGGTNYSTATFYDQRTTRDPNFAKTATDEWRPSEVLADTITILSNGFCDGGIIDTFTAVNVTNEYPSSGIDASAYNNPDKGLFAPGCGSSSVTSFMNQNRPNSAPQTNWNWQHENPSDPLSPVKISRNGHPLVQAPIPTGASKAPLPVEYTGVYNGGSTTIPGGYYNISGTSANSSQQKRSVQPVDPNLANPANPSEGPTVNTIFISGIVPSRLQQSYGGLHNFPRFLEWWQGVNLNFSGSFLQLNFSNYATAPYDEDVVEPAQDSNSFEVVDYNSPPNRLWGYDVALQMVPASPAAARFVTPGVTRNEFYTEPASNDPYMQNLCNALKANQAPNGPNLAQLKCPT